MHRADHDAPHYSRDGTGRFDPLLDLTSEFGTCYAALEPIGAFIETAGRRVPYLTDRLVTERVLTQLHLEHRGTVADVTSRTVLGRYGLTATVSAGGDYAQTRPWPAPSTMPGSPA